MEIPLHLPPGERQQEFIDQFNAGLRRISSGSTASAEFQLDGSFKTCVSGIYKLAPELEPHLSWTLVKTPEGQLSTVGVDSAEANPSPAWEQAAHSFVTKALAATVAGNRQQYFQRVSFAYIGPALDGEYWLPGFRLGPAIPNDAEPVSPVVERWADIDMHVDAIDLSHAAVIAGERARRIAARLSLLLDVGLERPPLEFRWVMVRGKNDTFENKRCQTMFQRVDHPTTMPEKGAVCPLGQFRSDVARYVEPGRLKPPRDIRRILRGADGNRHPVGDAFDRCARLYQVGRVAGKAFPSALLAYTIAAVDSITQADRTYAGFSDFMRQHSSETDSMSDDFLDFLYGKVRSGHFHGGEFPLGEFGPFRTDPLMDPEQVQASNLRFTGLVKIRAAILDWCLKKVAAVDG